MSEQNSHQILEGNLTDTADRLIDWSSAELLIYQTPNGFGWAGPPGSIDRVRELCQNMLAECDRVEVSGDGQR